MVVFELANAFKCLGTEESIIPISGGTMAPPKKSRNHTHIAPNQKTSVNGTGMALRQQIAQ